MDKGYYKKALTKKGSTLRSQSTIKMDKGYYHKSVTQSLMKPLTSQSTIKMDKGYYSQ